MRLDLGPPLAEQRRAAYERIDKEARAASEAVRPASLVWADRQREGDVRGILSVDPNYHSPDLFPALAAMPGNQSLLDKALAVKAAIERQHEELTMIEAKRLQAKAAIREAQCPNRLRSITLQNPEGANAI